MQQLLLSSSPSLFPPGQSKQVVVQSGYDTIGDLLISTLIPQLCVYSLVYSIHLCIDFNIMSTTRLYGLLGGAAQAWACVHSNIQACTSVCARETKDLDLKK